MVNGPFLYSAFLFLNLSTTQSAFTTQVFVSPVHTVGHTNTRILSAIRNSFTNIHTPVAQPLGAMWGSVSCPKTLWHVGRRSPWTTPPISRRPAPPPQFHIEKSNSIQWITSRVGITGETLCNQCLRTLYVFPTMHMNFIQSIENKSLAAINPKKVQIDSVCWCSTQ